MLNVAPRAAHVQVSKATRINLSRFSPCHHSNSLGFIADTNSREEPLVTRSIAQTKPSCAIIVNRTSSKVEICQMKIRIKI
jgi:hypothetical protein